MEYDLDPAKWLEYARAFFFGSPKGAIAGGALLWFIIAVVIISSVDTGSSDTATDSVKRNLGLFFLFIILAGALIFLLYRFAPIG